MKSLDLVLSAAGAIGSLLELPRTVRSLSARVDRANELASELHKRAVFAESYARQVHAEATKTAADLDEAREERRAAQEGQRAAESRLAALTAPVDGEPSVPEIDRKWWNHKGGPISFALAHWRAGHAAGLVRAARDAETKATSAAAKVNATDLAQSLLPRVEGEPVLNEIGNEWQSWPEFDGAMDVFVREHWRRGYVAGLAAAKPTRDLPRATDEELSKVFRDAEHAYAMANPSHGWRDADYAGVLAVAERVRREQCLVTRAVDAEYCLEVTEVECEGWTVLLRQEVSPAGQEYESQPPGYVEQRRTGIAPYEVASVLAEMLDKVSGSAETAKDLPFVAYYPDGTVKDLGPARVEPKDGSPVRITASVPLSPIDRLDELFTLHEKKDGFVIHYADPIRQKNIEALLSEPEVAPSVEELGELLAEDKSE